MNNPTDSAIPSPSRIAFTCLLLAGLVFILYFRVKNHEFITFDDDLYVSQNYQLLKGLTAENIKWAFTTFRGGLWMPMVWLSYMVDYHIHGMHAGGFLLTNVFFHALNTIIIFLVFYRITGAFTKSLFLAALFAFHPLRVESVAWVAERKDVLFGFFGFLSLGAYFYYAKKPGMLRFAGVLFLFICGLMSKPMLVTLPFCFLLLDYWPLGRFFQETLHDPLKIEFPASESYNEYRFQFKRTLLLILEKLPFLFFSGIAVFLNVYAGIQSKVMVSIHSYPFWVRLSNAILSYGLYLKKMVWPNDLAVFYPHPGIGISISAVLVSLLFLLVVTGLTVAYGKKFPWLPVGWFWYLGTLVPVIGITQAGTQALADRFTYLPSIGIALIVSWSLFELARKFHLKKNWPVTILATVTAVFFAWSFHYTGFWQNNKTLFRRALSVTKRNYPAHVNLGLYLLGEGKQKKAVHHFKKALEIDPGNPEANNNLGYIYIEKKQPEKAFSHLQTALHSRPDNPDIHVNLGKAYETTGKIDKAANAYKKALQLQSDHVIALTNLGGVFARTKNDSEAMALLNKALQIKPDHAAAHNNLGVIYDRLNQHEKAGQHYRAAIHIDPNNPRALNNLGNYFARKGFLEKALPYFEKALSLEPGYSDARNNLDNILSILGKRKNERKALEEKLQKNPRNPDTLNNLGYLLFRENRLEKAIQTYQKALAIQPDHVPTRINLALALAAGGKPEKARVHLERAIHLTPDNPRAYYLLAAIAAAGGKIDESLKWLEKSVENGFCGKNKLRNDPNFRRLHSDSRFQNLLNIIPPCSKDQPM